MKKIGLLTVYFADYGSFFHTAALYDMIGKFNYGCELVSENLRYRKNLKIPGLNIVLSLPDIILRPFQDLLPDVARTYAILKNDLRNYNISKRFFNRFDDYDMVVVGSDELWSFTNKNIMYFPEYFGININKPHISYATSGIALDVDKIHKKLKQIKTGLQSFSSIAVRDEITKKWIKEYVGLDVPVVLDPTLMNPFFAVQEEQRSVSNYIAVYGENFTDEQIKEMKNYANKQKLKLIALAWKHKWCDEFFNAKKAYDIQVAFANSKYCFVSTFHGCCFSVIQRKNFTAFTSDFRSSKIECLLETLKLKNRIFKGKIDDSSINYTDVDKILVPLREFSEKYLKSAIKKALEEGK